MSTTATATKALGVKYGSSELKLDINRNTVRAFVIVSSLLLLIFLLKFLYTVFLADILFPPLRIVQVVPAKASLLTLAPPPTNNNEPPPPPPPPATAAGLSGPATRAGTPVAVPDAMIAPDAKDFANIDEVSRASSVGGDGQDMGGFMDGTGDYGSGSVQIDTKEEIPDPDEFVDVQQEAIWDETDLNKRIKYPQLAKSQNLEGMVTLRVLVGKTGRAERIMILSATNKLFEQEAELRVRETVFTPAIQNGNPVATWITIPVRFSLR